MKFTKFKKYSSINPNEVLFYYWQSDCGGYKITAHQKHNGFAALYVGPEQDRAIYTSAPPDRVKGSDGEVYMCWKTFESAREACLEHKANLPW
jgi:hypothetical protein